MTPLPLVSVVVTCYNGSRYLPRQLASIAEQSYPHLEIIICDDASPDNSLEIAQAFVSREPRARVLTNATNQGLHRNLESGLRVATGEYIAIADQDDIWHPQKIERQLAALNGRLGSYSDSVLIDTEGKNLNRTLFQTLNITPSSGNIKPVPLLFKNCVSGHTLLFHRSLLSLALPFDDGFIFDHQLALAASLFGGLSYVSEPLVHHRIHGANHTNAGLANINKAQDRLSRTEKNARRIQERREHLFMQRDRIQYLLARESQANNELQIFGQTDPLLNERLMGIPDLINQFDRQFFNWQLFMRLRALGRAYPSCKKLRLKRCISLSKGARWYHIANHLLLR